jgi:putative chitinase
MMLQSPEQLMAATGCTRDRAILFLPHLQATMKAYEITTPRRMAGFLSQIAHESARLTQLRESLNYSVDGLLKTFGRHRISETQAKQFGRAPGRPANQEAIANTLYGGAWGARNLGNVMEGDGFRFVGRGLKQLTGRDNYRRCGLALREDFIMHPQKLEHPMWASLSAGWFWQSNGLNAIADRGDVRQMTKVVNGGQIGLAERTALYNQGLQAFA